MMPVCSLNSVNSIRNKLIELRVKTQYSILWRMKSEYTYQVYFNNSTNFNAQFMDLN